MVCGSSCSWLSSYYDFWCYCVFGVYSIPVEEKLIRSERMLINFARRRPARSKQQSFFWIKTYCILMNAGETYSQWFLKRIGSRMDEKFRMWFYESWSRLCGLGNSLNLWMIYLTENFAYFMLRKPFKKMRKFVVAMMTSNADEIECHSVTWDEKVVDARRMSFERMQTCRVAWVKRLRRFINVFKWISFEGMTGFI